MVEQEYHGLRISEIENIINLDLNASCILKYRSRVSNFPPEIFRKELSENRNSRKFSSRKFLPETGNSCKNYLQKVSPAEIS